MSLLPLLRQRKESSSASKSSSKSNPYAGRGLDKFESVYAELAAKRELVAAKTGASYVRFATSEESTWVPIIISSGKKNVVAKLQPERAHNFDSNVSIDATMHEDAAVPLEPAESSDEATTPSPSSSPSDFTSSALASMDTIGEEAQLQCSLDDELHSKCSFRGYQGWPQIASIAAFLALTVGVLYVGRVAAIGLTLVMAFACDVLLRQRRSQGSPEDGVLQARAIGPSAAVQKVDEQNVEYQPQYVKTFPSLVAMAAAQGSPSPHSLPSSPGMTPMIDSTQPANKPLARLLIKPALFSEGDSDGASPGSGSSSSRSGTPTSSRSSTPTSTIRSSPAMSTGRYGESKLQQRCKGLKSKLGTKMGKSKREATMDGDGAMRGSLGETGRSRWGSEGKIRKEEGAAMAMRASDPAAGGCSGEEDGQNCVWKKNSPQLVTQKAMITPPSGTQPGPLLFPGAVDLAFVLAGLLGGRIVAIFLLTLWWYLPPPLGRSHAPALGSSPANRRRPSKKSSKPSSPFRHHHFDPYYAPPSADPRRRAATPMYGATLRRATI